MINFFSDTQTQPSRAMRETVLDAVVGDEQSDLDPTTIALNERVAALLGKERALFLPSGTMCNEIAMAVHCAPGDEIIATRESHILGFEGGGPAALAHAMVHPVDADRGLLTPEQVRAAIRPVSRYFPRSRLLSVEQTVNLAGGVVWPVAQLNAVAEVAKEAGLATHMDGARLLNAAVKSGVSAAGHAASYDTVWIDFTKGLGAPVGAALAGSAAFIDEAWRFKQRWGGSMRQSGVIAVMCDYALEHNVTRLAEDHALAADLAERIAELPGVAKVLPADTNIVIFDLVADAPTVPQLEAALAKDNIRICLIGPKRVRIVTHLDVGPADGDALIAALQRHLG